MDDEDKEDFSKMDSKQKLRRWDFETDEDWVQYEQNREAVPKYTFRSFHREFVHPKSMNEKI
jgi:hypothetical protein